MEYKVLIKLYVPEIEEKFELNIPINKTVYTISKLLNKIVSEITSNAFPIKSNTQLLNRKSGEIYDNELIIRKSDIRNGTELILL